MPKEAIEQTELQKLIINALLKGETLSGAELAQRAEGIFEKPIKIAHVSKILRKINDSKKCELGHFVKQTKKDKRIAYCMVPEVLSLTADQAYDLTLKTQKDRYLLEDALRDFPDLQKYAGVDAKKVVKSNETKKKKAQPKKASPKKKTTKSPRKRGDENSTIRLILGMLLNGDKIHVSTAAEKIAKIQNKKPNRTEVSNNLYKLTDPQKCVLGNFIKREKQGRKYQYYMVPEACDLTLDQAHDMSLKWKKDRYQLEDAVKDIPSLQKYVEETKQEPTLGRKPAIKEDKATTRKLEKRRRPPRVRKISMTEKTLEQIRQFKKRPKRFAGKIFDVSLEFTEGPRAALDFEIRSLDLEWGDTLCLQGQFSESDITGVFYACGDICDWAEKLRLGKTYSLRVKTVFGVSPRVFASQGDEGLVLEKSVGGYLILEVKNQSSEG